MNKTYSKTLINKLYYTLLFKLSAFDERYELSISLESVIDLRKRFVTPAPAGCWSRVMLLTCWYCSCGWPTSRCWPSYSRHWCTTLNTPERRMLTTSTLGTFNSRDRFNCILKSIFHCNYLSIIYYEGKSSESVQLATLRRHGPAIAHCTDSEDFPLRVSFPTC